MATPAAIPWRAVGPQKHDRRGGGPKQLLLGRRDLAEGADHPDRSHQHRERLLVAALAGAQALDRAFVARVDQKLESTHAFERQNFTARQHLRRLLNRSRERRSADWAGVRLSVESSIRRVAIFPPAILAEREARHGRVGTVVRNLLDDRVPRPAVGAIDKRIKIPAVGRIEQLAQTIRASGEIGLNPRASMLQHVARQDLKPRRVLWIRRPRRQVSDHRGCRLFKA